MFMNKIFFCSVQEQILALANGSLNILTILFIVSASLLIHTPELQKETTAAADNRSHVIQCLDAIWAADDCLSLDSHISFNSSQYLHQSHVYNIAFSPLGANLS
jgi:hypothetical protein